MNFSSFSASFPIRVIRALVVPPVALFPSYFSFFFLFAPSLASFSVTLFPLPKFAASEFSDDFFIVCC